MQKRISSVSRGGRWLFITGAALAVVLVLHAAQSANRKRAKSTAKMEPAAMSSMSVVSVPTPASAPSPAAARAAAPAPAPASKSDPVAPLRAGEVLDYTVHFSKLTNVASIRLGVNGVRDFQGRPAWHLQAFAHTVNPLRLVFELDDQFDSYSDAATLASFQYELHLRERGQTVNSVLRMTTGTEPAPPDATAVRVLPGTRDPLAFLQFLRSTDWTKTKEVRGPVFDGRKLYDVWARLAQPAAPIEIPAGTFSASQIALRIFENGKELKDTRFTVSLANNPARTPVLLEAELPLGTARVELLTRHD